MEIEDWLGKDNTIGIDIWKKKYQHNNETFEQWLNRVSAGDEEVKQLIREKKFLFGGRILANRGLDKEGVKVTYSNCYVLPEPEDSIESIFDCAKQMARTFSYGGGVGVDISKLAPKGAKINNTADETSGAVSFTDLFSMVTGLIGQHGRRGALMLSMSCEHPDLEEFINAKTDVNRITKANMSVRVTDEFMNAVQNGAMYHQKFVRPETHWKIEKDIDAKNVFTKICDANYDYGEPGCLFWDRIKGWNLVSEYPDFHYSGVNPCVRGNTLILTSEGYVPISEVAGQPVKVWNGYDWSDVTPRVTGYDQPMLKVTFSDGSEVECTDYHKFVLDGGERVQADALRIGDKLIKNNFPVIDCGVAVDEAKAYTNGFFSGDGWVHHEGDKLRGYEIGLYGVKMDLTNYFVYSSIWRDKHGVRILLHLNKTDGMTASRVFDKEYVPSVEYNIKGRLDWLAGLIDSDGTLNSIDGSIAITSVSKEFLTKVKYMLNTLGCTGKIALAHEASVRMMPTHDKDGTKKEYACATAYRIVINASNVSKLMALGLNTHRVELVANPNRDASRFVRVVSVERVDDADVVYCMNEPKNHTFIANGVIVGNCAEEPLPAGGSCLLGSLNLSEFVNKDGEFEYSKFKNAVRIAVRALNDVLDEGLNLHPLDIQKKSVAEWRQVGLGIMGLADALIKMGLVYGSEESRRICANIGKDMINSAVYTSAMIAKEKGCFDKFDYKCTSSSAFYQANINETIDMTVKLYGMRNSQLLTIAPTGTLSTMLGISGGIEPLFATHFDRTTKSLGSEEKTYKIYPKIVQDYMTEHNLIDDSNLPRTFTTAQNLNYYDRVGMQATWQTFIDASISSTVNIPEDFPKDKVQNIYMSAWRSGCKGVTVFRDGCKRDSILTTKEKEKVEQSMTAHKESVEQLAAIKSEELFSGKPMKYLVQRGIDTNKLVGKQRTLVTGCGNLHVLMYVDNMGKPREVYLNKGSTGGCHCFMNGLSRMISLSLKKGVPLEDILDQLNSCGSCPSYAVRSATKHDTSKGSCCPMAVGNALKEMKAEVDKEMNIGKEIGELAVKAYEGEVKPSSKTETILNPCPICGANLIFAGGCNQCMSCGWSKCS